MNRRVPQPQCTQQYTAGCRGFQEDHHHRIWTELREMKSISTTKTWSEILRKKVLLLLHLKSGCVHLRNFQSSQQHPAHSVIFTRHGHVHAESLSTAISEHHEYTDECCKNTKTFLVSRAGMNNKNYKSFGMLA